MVFEVRLKRVPVIHDGTWDSEDPHEVTGRGSVVSRTGGWGCGW
ncbi:MAG: hypothetical protein QOG75_2144 [Mycobacterium sp.]|jgi:hypothetical protein|nr:hypothetical protein [Mycobacterium sp.]